MNRSPAAKHVSRNRLLALDKNEPIIVAEAPSGYGKTVLAHQWLSSAPKGINRAWVSLSEGAADPSVFLDQLAASLTLERRRSNEITLGNQANHAEVFAHLADRLIDTPQGLWLVIDDAHHVAGSPSRLYLQRLLFGANENLRIFITTQPAALDVGLGMLTAQGKTCWINADSLALNRSEVESLAKLCGQELQFKQLDSLYQATQGWPALIQLALAAPLESDTFLSRNITSSGPLREYIYERFLMRLDRAEHDALWALACAGGSAPFALLQALTSAEPDSAFSRLFSLGIVQEHGSSEDRSLRLHPLIYEAVLRLFSLRQTQGKTHHQLAAAHWYWQHGSGPEAVNLLIDAGAVHLSMARTWLIELAPLLLFKLGHHHTLLNLVKRWELASQISDPLLDRAAAWALIFLRSFNLAKDRIRQSAAAQPNLDDDLLQNSVMAALQDDYASAGKLTLQWLERHRDESTFYAGTAWTVHAFNLKCLDDFDGAHACLYQAQTIFDRVHSGYGTVWAHVVAALTLIKAGRHRDSLAEIERGQLRAGNEPELGGLRAMLLSLEAFVRYERNELPAARSALDGALPLLPEQGAVDTIILGFTAAARLRSAEGDLGAALDILSEGERCGTQRAYQRLSLSLLAERALLLLRNGASGQTAYTVASAGINHESVATGGLIGDRATRLYARLALLDGEPERAYQLLSPLLDHTRHAGQRYKLCELLILTALAEDMRGNEASAFNALGEALELGSVESYARVFLDEGTELHALLRRWLKARGVAGGHKQSVVSWAEMVAATAGIDPLQQSSDRTALAEPLNKRESQILVLLNQGLSNVEIGARCFLVEGTVKWHLHNLYGKLGVRSRTAALRAARSHHLLKT
ncbi:MAG: LuxR C-terminal-related transcriptional regulator [Stenotrophobium sp.]